MAKLRTPGLYLGGSPLQAVPLPNGPVHILNTSAGVDTSANLGARVKAIALTLTDPHWIRLDGDPASAGMAGEFKVPAGFTFWPIGDDAVAVSLYPEGDAAGSGDGQQVVGEYV